MAIFDHPIGSMCRCNIQSNVRPFSFVTLVIRRLVVSIRVRVPKNAVFRTSWVVKMLYGTNAKHQWSSRWERHDIWIWKDIFASACFSSLSSSIKNRAVGCVDWAWRCFDWARGGDRVIPGNLFSDFVVDTFLLLSERISIIILRISLVRVLTFTHLSFLSLLLSKICNPRPFWNHFNYSFSPLSALESKRPLSGTFFPDISGMIHIVHSYIPRLFSNHIPYHNRTVYMLTLESFHPHFFNTFPSP